MKIIIELTNDDREEIAHLMKEVYGCADEWVAQDAIHDYIDYDLIENIRSLGEQILAEFF